MDRPLPAQPSKTDREYHSRRSAALQAGLCITCEEAAGPKCMTEHGRRNYVLTGWCESCCEEAGSKDLEGKAGTRFAVSEEQTHVKL